MNFSHTHTQCCTAGLAGANGRDDNAIWTPDEVPNTVEDALEDDRPPPDYEFVYKQAVETTDTFLGMDPMGKDPTTTSCEDLVMRMHLPEAQSAAGIDLDLNPTWISIATPVQCALCPPPYC